MRLIHKAAADNSARMIGGGLECGDRFFEGGPWVRDCFHLTIHGKALKYQIK